MKVWRKVDFMDMPNIRRLAENIRHATGRRHYRQNGYHHAGHIFATIIIEFG